MLTSLFRFGRAFRLLPLALVLLAVPRRGVGQDPAPKPAPDVLIFTNGDQLTGKLVQAIGGKITFHSDMAGDLSLSLDKIKEMRSSGSFALLEKNQKVVGALVRPGSVKVEDGKLSISSGEQVVQTVPVSEVGYLIDAPTFRRETNPRPSIWYGWNGTLSAGATVVRATQNATTFNAATALVRTFPTVSYLPPRNRTLVDLSETYGTQRSPGSIPRQTPRLPDQVVKTSIFHADAEQDEYLSRRFYYLGEVAFDHNYALGLDLQQIYGAGVGWTPIMNARQRLDLKADVHYEKQGFFNSAGNVNLIGSTFTESYRLNLPHSIVFTELGDVIPSWNDPNAYSANVTAGLALPIFSRFAANLNATDNFINNPSPGYQKSSFQFVTGISYTLK
jgi:hypothetical protein